jgi:dienelactone hydrolase
MAALSSNAGYAVDIVVYPGAHHSFDSAAPVRFVAERTNSHAPGGKGATTGGDPAAWADAKLRVTEFFGRHLKR